MNTKDSSLLKVIETTPTIILGMGREGWSTYLFLRNLKLGKVSSFFGSAVFAFSSVIIARLEFGILGHAAVWLPLALLSEDKIFKDKK